MLRPSIERRVAIAMVDHVSAKKRSEIMATVSSQGSGPEMLVRRAAHKLGLRFRIHRRDLPGRPDLVFSRSKIAVFVHGCYWHRHVGCKKATTPKSNVDFWTNKFISNVERDQRAEASLRELGWTVRIVWQCELPDMEAAERWVGIHLLPQPLSQTTSLR